MVREGLKRILLDEFANFVAIAHRHKDVSQNEIGVRIRKAPHRGFAIANSDDFHAAFLERQHDHLLDIGIIVRNQNSGHCLPLAARPNRDTPNPST